VVICPENIRPAGRGIQGVRRVVMTLATNKLRILGKKKNRVTGEFSPKVVKEPQPKPAKKAP
jgi:hypothetical protein